MSTNLLGNDIGTEQAHHLVAILKAHPTLKSLCGNRGDETQLDMGGTRMGADGAIMLAPEIVANGALTSLNVSANDLGTLASRGGWMKKPSLQYCSPSGKYQMDKPAGEDFKMAGAIAIADAIRNNGALAKLDASSNGLCALGGTLLAEALTDNHVLQELNLANNSLGMEGTGTFSKADMSGIIAIRDAVPTMGALEKLRMAKNRIATQEAGDALGQVLAKHSVLKELDVSGDGWFTGIDGPGFAKGLANGIKNNAALTSLDISNNNIGWGGPEGAQALAEAIFQVNVSAPLFDWYCFELVLTSGSTAAVTPHHQGGGAGKARHPQQYDRSSLAAAVHDVLPDQGHRVGRRERRRRCVRLIS